MKKIINGKIYNTETARIVCNIPINKILYMTKKGAFFVLYSDHLYVVEYEKALALAEQHADTTTIEEFFITIDA